VEEHAIQGREIDLLKQQLSLTERESVLKDKVIEIEKQRTDLYKNAYELQKDLTGQALKLSKKTPLEQIIEWVLRIFLFVAGYAMAK